MGIGDSPEDHPFRDQLEHDGRQVGADLDARHNRPVKVLFGEVSRLSYVDPVLALRNIVEMEFAVWSGEQRATPGVYGDPHQRIPNGIASDSVNDNSFERINGRICRRRLLNLQSLRAGIPLRGCERGERRARTRDNKKQKKLVEPRRHSAIHCSKALFTRAFQGN